VRRKRHQQPSGREDLHARGRPPRLCHDRQHGVSTSPFGVSGIVVIAESHLAIHTWPERRYAAVDIFTCGDVLEPKVAADYLAEVFGAGRVSRARLERGVLGPRVEEMPDRLLS